MKTKTLNKNAMIMNINGLSVGDSAYCGPYGKITCTRSAIRETKTPRMFKVAQSKYLRNGGLWTMAKLRKAIEG